MTTTFLGSPRILNADIVPIHPNAYAAMRRETISSPLKTVGNGVRRRKCVCDTSFGLGRKCLQCNDKPLSLQRRSATHADTAAVPTIVHEVLRTPGQPLDSDTRAFMEPRFGYDFSQVRVHTNSQAVESAHVVNARAYTVGHHIVFGSSEYAPSSDKGRRLLAHELVHLQQQSSTHSVDLKPSLRISQPEDSYEKQAERLADRILSSDGRTPVPLSTSVGERNVLRRAVSYDECTPDEERIVLGSHNRAMAMLDTALMKLRRYDGTNPADVRTALDTHFHSTGTLVAQGITFNLFSLKGNSGSPQYECEAPQIGNRLGWTLWCVPGTDIELYPLWFSESDIDKRATTMIHEWLHRYECKFDLGYAGETGYASHGTLRALLNADSWAEFVYDVR